MAGKLALQRLWQDWLGLLYPQNCASCGLPLVVGIEGLCLACTSLFTPHPSAQAPNQNTLFDKLAGQLPLQAVAAAFYFEPNGPLQQAIHQAKYNKRTVLAHQLGLMAARQLLDTTLVTALPPGTVVVPIPLHSWRLWLRGYNQTALLAQGLADGFGLHTQQLLVRTRRTRSQVGLGREARHRNVLGAFAMAKGQALPPSVLLVDDVLTTGATLASAAKVLLAAGVQQVRLLALATPREQF